MSVSNPPVRIKTLTKLAKHIGFAHTSLHKAKRAGRITPEEDGSWDVQKVLKQLGETSLPDRKTAAFSTRPSKQEEAEVPADTSIPRTFHDARTANEVLKAQERRLKLDERRGKLVDKARAMMLVHRLAKEERDAILAWPARVAAEIAAELGVDAHRLQTMLDQRLREHLAMRHDINLQL